MMVLMMINHRRLLTVVVLTLILFSNCVISQRNNNSNNNNNSSNNNSTSSSANENQQQQKLLQSTATNATAKQQQQQNQENARQALANAATIASATTITNTSTTTTTTAIPTSVKRRSSSEVLRNGGGDSGEEQNSAEIFISDLEDAVDHASILPTTYRPVRPSIAPLSSAQEREQKLMNVLAARRSALHRGGFRTRIGTTGRTATSIETTSKSPTDPRSICIRNCTKNFTRRQTASCMRQCSNSTRYPISAVTNATMNNAAIVMRQSSKTGLGTQAAERDTNEILFTDESSHGLFVVAKDQNDTLNHIPDANKSAGNIKFRMRGKPAIQVATMATTSIEDDELQPYLYFGQKLPPLKPAMLTITSVSDEHPRLLEVSVAESTTSASISATSTLSAVERSRSRYKYNMRDRGTTTFSRRFTASGKPSALAAENSAELKAAIKQPSTLEQPKQPIIVMRNAAFVSERVNDEVDKSQLPQLVPNVAIPPAAQISSSTPLIITVLSDEDEPTQSPNQFVSSTEKPAEITIRAPTPTTTTTTSTTIAPTTTTTTTMATTTTAKTTTTTTETPVPTTSAITTTTTTIKTTTLTPIRKISIEEDIERLQPLDPTLAAHAMNMDDKTNLIIFVNRSANGPSSSVSTNRRTTTASNPLTVPHQPTTDASATILRTTVLTSIRSTTNPRTTTPATSTTVKTTATYVGVIETAPSEESTLQQPTATNSDISSTVVANEREVTLEMRRMNIVTMVLVGIGIFPLAAVILYLVRSYVIRRHAKADEDFDVCITDQQPISPVKKLDSKYHHEDNEDEVDHHHTQHNVHHQNKMPQRDLNHNHNHNRYDEQCSVTSDQEFDRSNIRLKSLLGEGNFGQVWKAEADDLSGHFGATRIVAVKTIRACSAQVGLKEEANIMRKLGSHQNVVTLLGACVESEPHMLIMEYAMRGRLLSLLRAARSANNILPASVPGGRSLAPLSPRTLAGFALDIACGMEYIAERRIVHRDLAARNVLLDHNGVCKICDFGMSIDLDEERKKKEKEKNCENDAMRNNSNKFKFDFGGRFIINHWSNNFGGNHSHQSPQKDSSANEKKGHHGHGHGHGHDTISRRPALPIRWMAPEALHYHAFTTETDVWAFGIVLWEIATLGSTPYSQITGREVIRRVPNGLRPDLPKEGRHEFYNLMARCWHKDPNMRPSFTQTRLEISRSLHKWVDDDSAASDYMDVSGFSEDLEHGMVYFNHRISEFECEI